MTHNAIRQAGYWIINGRSAVFKFIAKCVKCRKLRGATEVQKMAILPEERVKPSPPVEGRSDSCVPIKAQILWEHEPNSKGLSEN